MKYKYKKIVEITVEGELPLLGYDLKQVASKKHNEYMSEALRIAIKDGRETQFIKMGTDEFKVTIHDSLSSVDN
jgi:hypothetical protein